MSLTFSMSLSPHPSRLSHMYLYLRVKNCIDRPRGGPSYIYRRPIITRNEIFIFSMFWNTGQYRYLYTYRALLIPRYIPVHIGLTYRSYRYRYVHQVEIAWNISRPPPTAPGNNETDYDPHLVVARPEITDIWRLEVAHFRTALLLCVAGLWVLPCVFHKMM